MNAPSMYAEHIIDLYKHPENKREMNNPTHSYIKHNPLCGDSLIVYLRCKGNIIEDVSYTGQGCAISIAAASMMSEVIKGKTKKEVLLLTPKDIITEMGVEISASRMKCATLFLLAVQEALS